ncbi:MAG: asparagine synthase-related protein, partial [Candidatus Micrarchaeota archaeon]
MYSHVGSMFEKLLSEMRKHAPLAVAFSGGVDSSVVAKLAYLASDRSIAVTAATDSMRAKELEQISHAAREIGIKHFIIKSDIPQTVAANNGGRCFHCKKHAIKLIKSFAKKKGFKAI